MRTIADCDGRLDRVAAPRTRTREGCSSSALASWSKRQHQRRASPLAFESRESGTTLSRRSTEYVEETSSLVAYRSDPDQPERRSRAIISSALRSDPFAACFQHGRPRQILLVAPKPAFWCSL